MKFLWDLEGKMEEKIKFVMDLMWCIKLLEWPFNL